MDAFSITFYSLLSQHKPSPRYLDRDQARIARPGI
jgi:hypothetical protein